MSRKYYAVRDGRSPGVYNSWGECESQVKGYSGAQHKSFSSAAEASNYASGGGGGGYSGGGGGGYSGGGSSYSSSRSSGSHMECWTDGSCHNNGRQGSRSGIGVHFRDGSDLNVSEPHYGRNTNNSAEIEAAARACEQARDAGATRLKINTDSKFLVDSQTKWKETWKQNDWTTSTGEPVKNRDDFERLDRASQGLDVKYKHVPAHSGVYGNEAADRLANEGARRY